MPKRGKAVAVVLSIAVVAAVAAACVRGQAPAQPAKPAPKLAITLDSVRGVAVGEPVRLVGALKHAGSENNTVIALQQMTDGRWSDVATQRIQDDMSYAFLRIFDNPTKQVYRTVASKNGKTLGVSGPQQVTVSSKPKPSGTQLSPDLGAKKLTDCAASEQPCFRIVSSEGRRLLKFPAITVNIGDGPVEIHGYRSTFTSTDWVASLRTYYTSGQTQSHLVPKIVYYWAGDGHNHWHIKDFDYYQVLDKNGATLAVSEKHGFCFEDNTEFRDWSQNPKEHPQVPQNPVYKHESACGEQRPDATSIVHGLSVGWADTYPTTLPDQFIDITDLPDGDYVARVKVDGQGFIKESNEDNNTASVGITIRGTSVTVDSSSATGL
jgi:hypothetical protein